ncbi:MAG: hypothetical protein WCY36_03260 [Candidatus Omnitrophota bacterium]
MLDARSDRSIGIIYKRPFKVMIAVVTLMAFLSNTIFCGIAWSDRTPSELTSVGPDNRAVSPVSPGVFKELNVNTFTFPQSLGTVKDAWSPAVKGQKPRATVIHIQDAHCNYDAQHTIANIIEYFNKEYGVNQINLEGGAKDYDLSAFTGIKDKRVRERVADHFVKEGVVNGAEYFAVNNPEKASLWGIEDIKLYVENLKVYRDSLEHKADIDRLVKNLSYILSNLKMKIYSKELLEMDLKYNQYKSGNVEFKDYMNYLVANSKDKLIDIKSFPDIFLLNQVMKQEGEINFSKANNQRDELIDKLQKKLSKNNVKELVAKTVEFKAGIISQEEFYRYLLGKAKHSDLSVENFPELEKYIVYISSYAAIDKAKVMDEITELETKIRESLYQNEKQRALDKLSRDLAILKNIFNISLTRADYRYYLANKDAFDMKNYSSLIEREAPIYKINARLDDGMGRLDDYRADIEKFYEYSFKRDDAFMKNIKFEGRGEKGKDKGMKSAIVVTGGFHTENLCEQFKKQGIAYISIIPSFKNSEGYDCPYFNMLAGKQSSAEANIATVLGSHIAIASAFNNLGRIVDAAFSDAAAAERRHEALRMQIEWAIAIAEGYDGIIIKRAGADLGAIGADGEIVTIKDAQRANFKDIDTKNVIDTARMLAVSSAAATPAKPISAAPADTFVIMKNAEERKVLEAAAQNLAEQIFASQSNVVITMQGSGYWAGELVRQAYEVLHPDKAVKFIKIDDKEELKKLNGENVILLDDGILTAESMLNARRELISIGYADSSITSAALVAVMDIEKFRNNEELDTPLKFVLALPENGWVKTRLIVGSYTDEALRIPMWHQMREESKIGVSDNTLPETERVLAEKLPGEIKLMVQELASRVPGVSAVTTMDINDEMLEKMSEAVSYDITTADIGRLNSVPADQVGSEIEKLVLLKLNEQSGLDKNKFDEIKDNMMKLIKWLAAAHDFRTAVAVEDEGDGKQHSVYVITVDGNTYILEVGDRGTFTATISFIGPISPASVEIVRHGAEAEALMLAQAKAAAFAQDDVQSNVADWIVLPGNEQFISTHYAKMFANRKNMARIFDKDSSTNVRDYMYSGDYSEKAFRDNMENTIIKIAAEMRDAKYADKKPRAIIFAPAKEYETKGEDDRPMTGRDIVAVLVAKVAPDLKNNFVIVRETIPDNGVIHEAIHVDLGRELLNYKRQTEVDAARFTAEEKRRLFEHIRLVTPPEITKGETADSLLTGILNGRISLEVIKPVDLNKWDEEQKAYIALRQSA